MPLFVFTADDEAWCSLYFTASRQKDQQKEENLQEISTTMRELLICPFYTILNCKTTHVGHIFHENNLGKKYDFLLDLCEDMR